MGKSDEWDFDAPKFWDLTGKDSLKRPTDTWFSKDTISPASFERQTQLLQPIFPTYKIGLEYNYKKKKLLNRVKGVERLQNSQDKNDYTMPDQSNKVEEYYDPNLRTCTDHVSLLQHNNNISSLSNNNPITVEMGRNRVHNEETEVKRKYVYMNYDRMHETIKRAKSVLQESRKKSEQWLFIKKNK